MSCLVPGWSGFQPDRPWYGTVLLRRAFPMDPSNPFTSFANDLFLSLLPKLELHGSIFFGHVKCTHKRQDAIAEMIAVAWKWFIRLVERGKDPSNFPTTFVTFAARAVYSGRRLCGQEKTKDVLSSLGQQRHGFAVQPLPAFSSLN